MDRFCTTRLYQARHGYLLALGSAFFLLLLGMAPAAQAQAPVNDDCAAAIALPVDTSCVVTTANNTGATASAAGTVPPNQCGNGTAPPDVWFTAVVPANGVVIVQTSAAINSRFRDSVVELYSGVCGSLSPLGCNDDIGPGNFFSRVQVTGQPAGTILYIRVRSFGATGDFGICATTDASAACQPPVAVTIGAITDSTAVVNFTPSISGPVSYTVTATPTSGAAVSTTVSAPPAALTGLVSGMTYTVSVVSNCLGGLTSTAATTTFTTLSPALPCPAPSNVQLRNVTATTAAITFVPAPGTTGYELTYQESGGIPQVLTPAPAGSPIILTNLTPSTVYLFTLQAQCPAGLAAPYSSTFTTSMQPQGGDNCPDATLLPVRTTCTPTLTTTLGATASTEPPPGCGGNIINDVWFATSVPANGILQVTTSQYPGSPVNDTGLALYSGMCGTLTLLGCNDDMGPGNHFSQLRLTNLAPGSLVYIRTWKWGGGNGERFYICATTDASAACATPASLVATASTPSSLTVDFGTSTTASSYLLTYQLGTGAASAVGITGTPYTLTGLVPDTAYQVCVSSVCGGNLSAPLCATLRTAPQVITATAADALAAAVELFPNPAHTVLLIRLPATLRQTSILAACYNSMGQLVRQQVLPADPTGSTAQLEVAGLPAGLYSLRLTTASGSVVKRLAVE